MQLQPKASDYPRIRRALAIYKVTSIVTGIMLLMLCAVMVMKYAFGVQLYLFGPEGVAHFYPIAQEGLQAEFKPEGFDLFRAFLIAHGWFYVIYLISDFMLWSPMRWNFMRFLVIALGGVIPLMSFFLEARIVREVDAFLASKDALGGSATDSSQTSPTAGHSA